MLSVGDFFVLMWNDEERWWCIGGLVVAIIFVCKLVLIPLWNLFGSITSLFRGSGYSGNYSTYRRDAQVFSKHMKTNKMAIVTIKGVYQMNGPRPFTRTIECPYSETGYYSQLMDNKSKQAQWIQANFPGANVSKVFSMTVNIK